MCRRIRMEIKIIRENDEELEMEFPSENHTFSRLLTDRLAEDENVVYAGYRVDHPLVGAPMLYVKVKEGIEVPEREEKKVELSKVVGVGPKRKEQLQASGIEYANQLLEADIKQLHEKSGIPEKTLQNMVEEAEKLDYGRLTAPRYVLQEALKGISERFGRLKESFTSRS